MNFIALEEMQSILGNYSCVTAMCSFGFGPKNPESVSRENEKCYRHLIS